MLTPDTVMPTPHKTKTNNSGVSLKKLGLFYLLSDYFKPEVNTP